MIHLRDLADRLRARKSGSGFVAKCPAHDDRHPSLSINEREGKILLKCHADCNTDDVLAAVGLTFADLYELHPNSEGRSQRIDEIYHYDDAAGQLTFQVVRYYPKDFRQRRPDGSGGFIWNREGVKPILYRLPELLEAHPDATVFISEGEKDVNRLRSLGFTATCNPGGAGKWRSEFAESLRDRDVVVLPDNDDAGRAHAETVAASLYGVARSLKVLELLGLPEKGDVSDWLNVEGNDETRLSIASTKRPLQF